MLLPFLIDGSSLIEKTSNVAIFFNWDRSFGEKNIFFFSLDFSQFFFDSYYCDEFTQLNVVSILTILFLATPSTA